MTKELVHYIFVLIYEQMRRILLSNYVHLYMDNVSEAEFTAAYSMVKRLCEVTDDNSVPF